MFLLGISTKRKVIPLFYCGRFFARHLPLLVVFICAAGFMVIYHQNKQPEQSNSDYVASKLILIWDERDHIDLQVLDQNSLRTCPYSECILSRDRSRLNEADGVVFNMPSIFYENFPRDPHRRPEQRYIFLSPEPPVLFGEHHIEKFNGLFNWTMSYRLDSDILYSYGQVEPATLPSVAISSTQKLNKTKLVAWFVSHCFTHSRREAYVEDLSKHIPVDIYGECLFGNQSLHCDHNTTTHLSDDHCYDMLENNYKFYLAFENSNCNEYITEKFFKLLQRRIIPVVLGGADYSAVAPPNSYIDARKFSPKKLAAFLRNLAQDDEAYEAYFEWKDRYKVTIRYPDMADRALCSLCTKLHTDRNYSVVKDLTSTWDRYIQCPKPRYKGLPLVFGIF